MNNPFECGKCNQAFDWDLDLLQSDNKEHRLPVSCKFCPYTVCYSCFCHHMAKDIRRGYLECPCCENGIGFYYCKEDSSCICPFACSLLCPAARETQPTHTAAVTSHPKQASSENVARIPRHHDESDGDSITRDIRDSKMPAVTQSQADVDDDDDDTVLAEPSGDEDHDDDVAQSEAVPSNQSKSVSTPKRKQKSRSSESQDESSNVAVVTPPKKKRNVDGASSEKTIFEITQAERQALKDRPRWLDEFTGYLRNNLELSENNVKRIVDSINHLRLGHGVNYAPKSQEPIKFQRGTKIDLSTNLQELLEAAKAFENEQRKDTSHGWKVRHPITKLALFQEHIVKLMRAESSIENDE